MNIELLHEPENKTNFNPGDKVMFTKESGASFADGGSALVVGEDNDILHIFNINSGGWFGIAKQQENLSALEIV